MKTEIHGLADLMRNRLSKSLLDLAANLEASLVVRLPSEVAQKMSIVIRKEECPTGNPRVSIVCAVDGVIAEASSPIRVSLEVDFRSNPVTAIAKCGDDKRSGIFSEVLEYSEARLIGLSDALRPAA